MGKASKKPTREDYRRWFGAQSKGPQGRLKALKSAAKFAPPPDRYPFQEWPAKRKAKMMKKILKQEHPDVSFSVRSTLSSYGAVDINWEDGPSTKTIEKLQLNKYNRLYPNVYGSYDSNDYVFLNRRLSPKLKARETKRILSKHADVDKMMSYRKEEIVYREMYQTDYSKAGVPGIAKKDAFRPGLVQGPSRPGVPKNPKKI